MSSTDMVLPLGQGKVHYDSEPHYEDRHDSLHEEPPPHVCLHNDEQQDNLAYEHHHDGLHEDPSPHVRLHNGEQQDMDHHDDERQDGSHRGDDHGAQRPPHEVSRPQVLKLKSDIGLPAMNLKVGQIGNIL
jgi:hypothetical protein